MKTALALAALLLASLVLPSSTASAAEGLNIVLSLIDDLGWMDVGCHGSTYYRTPNIDRLARGAPLRTSHEGAKWKVASFSVNMGSAPAPTGRLGARQVRT